MHMLAFATPSLHAMCIAHTNWHLNLERAEMLSNRVAPSPVLSAADQPLNDRTIRIWVDATPCAATLAAAVQNSTALATLVGPIGNATPPISISAYEFAVAANLTQGCVVKSGAIMALVQGWRIVVAGIVAALVV